MTRDWTAEEEQHIIAAYRLGTQPTCPVDGAAIAFLAAFYRGENNAGVLHCPTCDQSVIYPGTQSS